MTTEERIKRLNTLKQLLDDGVLTPKEVEDEKKSILALESTSPKTLNSIQEKDHTTADKKKYLPLIGILGGCLLVAIVALITLLYNGKTSKTAESQVSSLTNRIVETNNEQEQKEIVSLVNLWCEYHSSDDVLDLSYLYGPQVKYYQSDYSREKVIDSKRKLFSKPGYHGQSASDFRFEERNDGYRRVYFTKNTQNNTYPSYLGVKKIGGTWKIVEESDLITDKNLANRKLAPMALLAEDAQFGYYAKTIQKPVDEFDSAIKELYRFDKQTYDIEYQFTGGGEKATTLSPLKPGEDNVIVWGIDSVHILSPSRIVVCGWSAPNNYSYLFDTESKKCSNLGGDFSRTKKENGQDVIVVIATRLGDRGRETYERIIDFNGNYLHEGEVFGSIYDD